MRIFFLHNLPRGSGSFPSARAPEIAKNTGTENLQKMATPRLIQNCKDAGWYVENKLNPFVPVWLKITKKIANPLKNL